MSVFDESRRLLEKNSGMLKPIEATKHLLEK
jgi:hypothetical protein